MRQDVQALLRRLRLSDFSYREYGNSLAADGGSWPLFEALGQGAAASPPPKPKEDLAGDAPEGSVRALLHRLAVGSAA